MKTALMVVGAAIAATTWTTPATACSYPGPPPLTAVFAERTVPLNAELWVAYADGYEGFEWELVAPDGSVIAVDVEYVGDAFFIADAPLTPGAWRLRNVDENQFFEIFDFAFDVVDDLDEAAPTEPVVVVEEQQRGGPGEFFGPCGGSLTPWTQERITVTIDADTALLLIDGVPYIGDGTAREIEHFRGQDDVRGDVDVTAIDFAGNETSVIVSRAGGGCASTPAVPASVLALALFARRRRR